MGKQSRISRRATQNALKSGEFWHGGALGLEVGDTIRSQQEQARLAGRPFTLRQRSLERQGNVTRPDRVYFSTDRELARFYAYATETRYYDGELMARGTLYRVEPLGAIHEDSDFAGLGVSWSSAEATIVEVVDRTVDMSKEAATRAIGRYQTWDDYRPMYEEDGRMVPSPQMESYGVTPAELAQIVPIWTPWEEANTLVERALRGGLAGHH